MSTKFNNNRQYLSITGAYNGSAETRFVIKVTGTESNEKWHYEQTDTGTNVTLTPSVAVTIAVSTPYQLGTTGVYIEFTHKLATDYQDGDEWSFITSSDVTLYDSSSTNYDYIETIKLGVDSNLVAINKTSGDVSVIAGIDGDNPILDETVTGLNIGAVPSDSVTLDFEKKNKEIYVAKGKDAAPVWLGYSTNAGFAGNTEPTLKAVPALDVLSGSENAQEDVFDESIMLRGGGGADTVDAKLIVGIKKDINSESGEHENKVFVMNMADNKLYNWSTATEPIAIKRWYGIEQIVSGVSYCDGFAVMRRHTDSNYGCFIDFWNVNSGAGSIAGQQANMYNTIQIKKPAMSQADCPLEAFSDFLIVPMTSDMTSSTQTWRVMVSRSKAETDAWSEAKRVNYEWLWSSLGLSRTQLDTPNFTIADDIEYDPFNVANGFLMNITPSLYDKSATLSKTTRVGGEMYYMVKLKKGGEEGLGYNDIGEGNITLPRMVPIHAKHLHDAYPETTIMTTFRDTPKHCLEFAGFDDMSGTVGAKPIVYFTIKGPHPVSPSTEYNTGEKIVSRLSVGQEKVITGPNWVSGQSTEADGDNFEQYHGSYGLSWGQKIAGPFIADNGTVVSNGTYGGYIGGATFSTTSNVITHDPGVIEYTGATPRVVTPGMHIHSQGSYIPQGARVGVVNTTTEFTLVDESGAAMYPLIAQSTPGRQLFANLNGTDLVNDNEQNFRGINWVTYAIDATTTYVEYVDSSTPFGHTNIDSAKHPVFLHMLDWNSASTTKALWLNVAGGGSLDWGDNAIDSQITMTGRENDKVKVYWRIAPTYQPTFRENGRIITGTIGVKRQRHLLSYVRPGNSKILHFRFGVETGYPQAELDALNPRLFPNDWSHTSTTNNASYWWNKDLEDANKSNYDATNSIAHYGTAALSDNIKRISSITSAGTTGDYSALLWRASEQGKVNTNAWYPAATERLFVSAVPSGNNTLKQLFKTQVGQTVLNEYASSAAQFSIETPVESTVHSEIWAGIVCDKVYYQASLVYDGYQETSLISTRNSLYASSGIVKHIYVEIRVDANMPISDRVTGVALYRATSKSDASEPETLYRFLKEIPLYQFNEHVSGYQTITITDTGDAEGTYEALNGISEQSYALSLNYGVNTQQNGFHFVGDCSHSQLTESENYLFRSQPGKFSIFDWTKDFVQLPFVPVAIKGFMGKVYAFSNNQVAVINPNNLFIEDVIDGIGCINSKSIIVTDSGMMWCDYKNIYLAAPSIKPIGSAIQAVETEGWLNIPNTSKDKMRCGYDAKRGALLLFYTVGSKYRCWAYSVAKNRWDLFETPSEVKDTALTKDGATMLLLSDNTLVKFLAHTTERLDWSWESKRLQLGTTMISKKIRNIKTEGNNKVNTALTYKLDGDSDWKTGTDIPTIGAQNKATKLQQADRSKKIHWVKTKIDGDNNTVGSDVKVYASSIIFKQKRPK